MMILWIVNVIILVLAGLWAFALSKKSLFKNLKYLAITFSSLGISYLFLSIVAGFVKDITGIYDWMKNALYQGMGLSTLSQNLTLAEQRKLLTTIQLPKVLGKNLQYNQNSEIYQIFKVDNVGEYISGYIANILLNGVLLLILSVVLFIIISSFADYWTNRNWGIVKYVAPWIFKFITAATVMIVVMGAISLISFMLFMNSQTYAVYMDFIKTPLGQILYLYNPLFLFTRGIII